MAFSAFWNDVRFVIRQLARQRAFTVTVVATLAFGLGANTALFSSLHALIWRDLPYPGAERLMAVHRNGKAASASWQEVRAIATAQTLEASGGITLRTWGMAIPGGPSGGSSVVLSGMFTPGWFDVLGVTPVVGRTPAANDFRQVWLSFSFWQRQFEGNRSIPGTIIHLNEEPYTVAGVLPEWFQFQYQDKTPDIFFPLENGYNATHLIVRLRRSGAIAAAQAEQEIRSLAVASGEPTANQLSLRDLRRELHGGADQPYYLLLSAVAFVLLIACLNLTNLLLARLQSRAREFSIRRSIGASHRQLIRLILIETAILSGLGAICGAGIAAWSSMIWHAGGIFAPRFDAPVAMFLASVTAVVVALISVAPIAIALRSRPVAARAGVLRGMLIAGQVAGGFVLLTVTLLLLRSFEQVATADPGFDSRNVLIGGLGLPEVRYNTSESMVRFYEKVQSEALGLPGVVSATFATTVPLVNSYGARVRLDNSQQEETQFPLVRIAMVAPSYFRTMGIAMQQGRPFTATDRTGEHPRVAIVNEAFARAFGSALGGQVRLSWWNGEHPKWAPWAIAGIVANTKSMRLDEPGALPTVYLPLYQFVSEGVRLLIRTKPGFEGTVIRDLSQRIHAIDAKLETIRFRPLTADIGTTLDTRRRSVQLFSAFGLVALLLCAGGLFGLTAGAVREKSRELAIRRALGADTGEVVASAFRSAGRWALVGLVGGMVIAYWAARAVASQLFGVTAVDPIAWAVAAVALAIALVAGGLLPARRAARVDPATLLRHE